MKKILTLLTCLSCMSSIFAFPSEKGFSANDISNEFSAFGPGDTLTMTMDSVLVGEGDNFSINVRVQGFDQLAVLEGTIGWNASKSEFVGVSNFGVDNLNDDSFARPVGRDNKLTFTWTEPQTSGQSVEDGSILFTLTFKAIGAGGIQDTISFDDEPLDATAFDNELTSVEIVENDGLVDIVAPINLAASVQNVSCAGGNDGFIALDVTGGSDDFAYLWSNGATVDSIGSLTVGTYSFLITDQVSGLTVEDSVRIVGPEAILIEIKDVSAEEDTLSTVGATVTGGVGPYAYLWSNGDTTSQISELENGIYELTVTDQNGCEAIDSITVEREMSSSLIEVNGAHWKVFPNPTQDLITLKMGDGISDKIQSYQVFDIVGRQVMEGKIQVTQNLIQIDLAALNPAIYYVKINEIVLPVQKI